MAPRMLAAALLLSLVVALPAAAQQPSGQQPAQPGQQKPDQPPQEPQVPEESPVYEEQVVVTASKAEEQLVNAPASVSVLPNTALKNNASTSYADLFRAVPGLNVTQTSARDINLTARGATSTLSTGQLALVDGRSIYLDFFGFVAWDFLPVSTSEVKQIEVIRGPASAVWGGNAINGVVNFITLSPRENQGANVSMGAGIFGRKTANKDNSDGSLFYINGSYADAPNDRWSYKVSAGVYSQDPLARPTGTIPNGTGTQYPNFTNQGTTQPKLDGRVDYDWSDGKKLVFQGGFAGTEGILHSGIGPFDIDQGSVLGYGKVNYSKGAFKLNFFTNILDASATNLLAFGADGKPIGFNIGAQTYDVEVGNVTAIAGKHVLSYGGNFRRNNFDLSIAPLADHRTEAGAYLQDDIFLTSWVRAVVGIRLDKFDIFEGVNWSPRVALMFKPAESQTVRVSFNKAFRAPSVINEYLDTTIINELDLGALSPALAGRIYRFPIRAIGTEVEGVAKLDEQEMEAYEISYTGRIKNRATVTAAFYVNNTKDDVYFTQVASYRGQCPPVFPPGRPCSVPPGWPLPPFVLEAIVASGRFGAGNGLPSAFSYRQFGEVQQKGFELGVDGAFSKTFSGYANYSFLPDPDTTDIPAGEFNIGARHRFNVGMSYDGPRYVANMAMGYTDRAYWQDVLDFRYAGYTDPFTQVNGVFGVKWGAKGRTVTSVKVTNLLNQEIQQHIFGDISRLQAIFELRTGF